MFWVILGHLLKHLISRCYHHFMRVLLISFTSSTLPSRPFESFAFTIVLSIIFKKYFKSYLIPLSSHSPTFLTRLFSNTQTVRGSMLSYSVCCARYANRKQIYLGKKNQKADLSWAENKQLSGRFQISPDKDCMLWLSAQSLETFILKQQIVQNKLLTQQEQAVVS